MSNRPAREASTYLQIRPGRFSTEAKVVKATQRKPEFLEADCVVVRVRLRLPAEAWDPFQPEAVIHVPADLVQRPVDAEAVDPS